MAGYPGTIAATWQRAGRAGRRTTRSAAVLVASSAPIDQFIVRNPSYFFDGIARARAHQSGQPAHPARSCEVCGVRAAVPDRRAVLSRRRGRQSISSRSCRCCGGRVRPFGGRAMELDERILPGRRGQPAVGVVRQLRRRRLHQRRAGDRRNRFHQRPATLHEKAIYILEGQLFQVERSTSMAARPTSARWTATTTPTRSPIRRSRSWIRSIRIRMRYPGCARDPAKQNVGSRDDPDPAAIPIRDPGDRTVDPTAKSTSCHASSDSRRSSSTPTRTSAPASSICRSSRCTPRRTG